MMAWTFPHQNSLTDAQTPNIIWKSRYMVKIVRQCDTDVPIPDPYAGFNEPEFRALKSTCQRANKN